MVVNRSVGDAIFDYRVYQVKQNHYVIKGFQFLFIVVIQLLTLLPRASSACYIA